MLTKEQVWIPAERVGQIEVREYVHGDQARHNISISEADLKLPSLVGGFVARNPDNHADQWYIARDYFNKHYRLPAAEPPVVDRVAEKISNAKSASADELNGEAYDSAIQSLNRPAGTK